MLLCLKKSWIVQHGLYGTVMKENMAFIWKYIRLPLVFEPFLPFILCNYFQNGSYIILKRTPGKNNCKLTDLNKKILEYMGAKES